MNEEIQVEDKPELALNAEETTPAPDAVVETTQEETTSPEANDVKKPGPLEPGGDRFKQVWARAKSAEDRERRIQEELQREREDRIRMEERLKALEEKKQEQNEPEFSWDQLETFIAEGRITRQQAQEHRDQVLKKSIKKELENKWESLTENKSRESLIVQELDRYKALVPSVMQPGSAERQRYEREYQYLTQKLNYPQTYATQLAAVRAALGDVQELERTIQAKRSVSKETFEENSSSTNKPQKNDKDPLKSLTPRQHDHYSNMIKRGVYRGWDEVKEELLWEPQSLGY